MGKLWVFGDSNSALYHSETIKGQKWMKDYVNYLGHSPKNFSTILSEKLELDLENHAMGGIDNTFIIQILTNHIKKINQDEDIVLIGVTAVERFRVADFEENYFVPVSPMLKYEKKFPISKTTMYEMLANRTHPLFLSELYASIDLVKFALRGYKVYFWSVVEPISLRPGIINPKNLGQTYSKGNFTTIRFETNGKVDDGHFGENGNEALADAFYSFITETDNRKINYIYNTPYFPPKTQNLI